MSDTAPAAVRRQAPLTSVEIDQLLAILTRNPAAYDALVEVLPVAAFRVRSQVHALVWKLVRKHSNRYGELPEVGHLRTAIDAALAEDPDAVQDEELGALNELVEYVFDPTEHGRIATSKTAVKVAVDAAKRLLYEQKAAELVADVQRGGQVPVDLPAMITRQAEELARVEAIGESALSTDPFPDGWEKRSKARLVSCGVPVLNAFLGGGWRGGEVVLFMGPYGSCKTMLCVMGVAGSLRLAESQYAAARAHDPAARRPVVFLLFTEGDADTYRMRLLSNLAQVPWKRLMQMEDVVREASHGTRPGQYRHTRYEKPLFRGMRDAGSFLNERQRILAAVELCRRHLILADCSGNDPRTSAKVNGPTQLLGLIRACLRARPDADPMSFWLDHMSALAARMAALSEGADMDRELRRHLNQLPLALSDRLAKPFNAPVMIFHQLSGAANAKRATGRVHHTDAAGSKSVAEFVDFAVVTGPPDGQNLCVFDCTKHRREPPTSRRVVSVRGEFNQVIDVSKEFNVDIGRREIRSKAEMKMHAGRAVSSTVVAEEADNPNAEM